MSVRKELAKRPSSGCAETMFPRNATSVFSDTGIPIPAQAKRDHSFDVLELIVSYALILSANWTSDPARQWLYGAAVIWIGGSMGLALARTRSIQFRLKEIWNSLWIVGGALMLAAPTIAIAARMHTLQQPYGPMGRAEAFAGYALWAIAQQWLLWGYFLSRLARTMPRESWAAVIVAGLFAIAHLPNLILTVMALFWGLAASYLFLRFRSVVTLGCAHAILGIAVAISIPGPVLHNMRVGLDYLQYRTPVELRVARNDARMTNASWDGHRRQSQEVQGAEEPLK